jgi:hypothetical protein
MRPGLLGLLPQLQPLFLFHCRSTSTPDDQLFMSLCLLPRPATRATVPQLRGSVRAPPCSAVLRRAPVAGSLWLCCALG